MPGLAADLDLELADGDRVGIFHTKSMWPVQYRFGAAVTPPPGGKAEGAGGFASFLQVKTSHRLRSLREDNGEL